MSGNRNFAASHNICTYFASILLQWHRPPFGIQDIEGIEVFGFCWPDEFVLNQKQSTHTDCQAQKYL